MPLLLFPSAKRQLSEERQSWLRLKIRRANETYSQIRWLFEEYKNSPREKGRRIKTAEETRPMQCILESHIEDHKKLHSFTNRRHFRDRIAHVTTYRSNESLVFGSDRKFYGFSCASDKRR